MLHAEYENRLISACRDNEPAWLMGTPPKGHLIQSTATSLVSPISASPLSASPPKPAHGDRFTPSRVGSRWHIDYHLLQTKFDARGESEELRDVGAGENSIDARKRYSCMLKNELLGTTISDVRLCPMIGGGGDGNQNSVGSGTALAATDPFRIYTYRTPRHTFESPSNTTSPFSVSRLSDASQALLHSPTKTVTKFPELTTRKIPETPYKVLHAFELPDNFYVNLIDWSSQNVLAVGVDSAVWLRIEHTSLTTRLCDLSAESDFVTSVSWTEKGNLLAIGTFDGFVHIWDVATRKRVGAIKAHGARVGALSWNGSSQLFSGSSDRCIRQMDIRMPRTAPDRRLLGHRREVCGLKWSPDMQHLASGGSDKELHVWNLHSNQPVQTYGGHMAAIKAIAWSPHRRGLLASGGGADDRCIRFWDTRTGRAMDCVDTGSQVCNLAWSKHTSEFVSTHGFSSNNPILLWKYPSLERVAELNGHSRRVLFLSMSPCGESIVTGGGDGTLRFWNVFPRKPSMKQVRSALDPFVNIR